MRKLMNSEPRRKPRNGFRCNNRIQSISLQDDERAVRIDRSGRYMITQELSKSEVLAFAEHEPTHNGPGTGGR
jgi:hypothetical protein